MVNRQTLSPDKSTQPRKGLARLSETSRDGKSEWETVLREPVPLFSVWSSLKHISLHPPSNSAKRYGKEKTAQRPSFKPAGNNTFFYSSGLKNRLIC